MTWPKSIISLYNTQVNKNIMPASHSAVTSFNASGAPFYDVMSLCDYLNTDIMFLEVVLKNIGKCYSTFYIDKDTKRITRYDDALNLREVNAPCKGLKEWQIKLMEFFGAFPKHPANYAFIAGRNIKDAAESIADNDVLIHVDLKDFFPSHSALYLISVLKRLSAEKGWAIQEEALIAVVKLCCLANHELPQGSPCSPLLTIICNYDMDNRLSAVAEKYNLEYSRYADDLWFGSKEDLKGNLKQILSDIKEAVHPFRINFKKLNVMKERALPILEGFIIKPNKVLTSGQWGHLANQMRAKFGSTVTANLSYTNKVISVMFTQRPEIPISDVLAYGMNLVNDKKLDDAGIRFVVKPKFFYVQSVKKCLGMHIHKDMVKYPRKKYNDLRMQAFLFGRQRGLYRFSHRADNRNQSEVIKIKTVLNAFASLHTHNANSFRNLYKKPMNRRSFNGKLAFLASIDPEKAQKIKRIEENACVRCTEQLVSYCAKHGISF